jgi:hypothetical protein
MAVFSHLVGVKRFLLLVPVDGPRRKLAMGAILLVARTWNFLDLKCRC